ncbi:MAG: riboflavin synthase [Lentisphaeria bacterium]|nr:riboflavin synthase [Lentisphaeria bacterium]
MFTGIVEMRGILQARRGHQLLIRTPKPLPDPVYGESIAVNGCCLTLEACRGTELTFHVLSETLSRTNLGQLPIGAAVNLERALKVSDRLGGHLVSGHIDAVGKVLARRLDGDVKFTVSFPEELAKYMVWKGSIAIDGVSLTIAELDRDTLTVCLIPVTLAETALESRNPGDPVNLETDMAGKYIVRQLELAGADRKKEEISMDTLFKAGFL